MRVIRASRRGHRIIVKCACVHFLAWGQSAPLSTEEWRQRSAAVLGYHDTQLVVLKCGSKSKGHDVLRPPPAHPTLPNCVASYMCLNRRNPCIAAVKIYCKVSWTPLRNTIFVSLTRWSASFNLQNIPIKRLVTEMSPGQSVQRTCCQSKIMIHEKKKPRVTYFVWTKKPLLPLLQRPQDACFEILMVFSSRICGFLLRALHVNPACTCVTQICQKPKKWDRFSGHLQKHDTCMYVYM